MKALILLFVVNLLCLNALLSNIFLLKTAALGGASSSSSSCLQNETAVYYLFSSCPPSRRYEPIMGNDNDDDQDNNNTSLFGNLTATGLAQDWVCGRQTGLRLQPNDTKPRALTSNMTTCLAGQEERLSLFLRFQPANTSAQGLQTLMSISSSLANMNDNGNDVSGCHGTWLQIGQYGRHLFLRYREASSFDCRVLLLRKCDLSKYSILNFVLAANQTDSLVFLNGTLIHRSTGLDFASLSNTGQSCQVVLFGSRDNDIDYFRGSMHLLSLSNEILSEHETRKWGETMWGGNRAFPLYEIVGMEEPNALVIPQGSNESHVLPIPVPVKMVVKVQLLSLPGKGVVQLDDEQVLAVGSNFTSSTRLVYSLTDKLFFDNPNINARGIEREFQPEGFSYRLRSFDDDGFLVAQSALVHFPIHVQLVNHRPELKPPRKVVPSGKTWTLSGMELLDSLDDDMNLVRVDVSPWRGRATVSSPEGRSRLRQYECSGRSASLWQCSGDGDQDRLLTFVAAPSDVTFILQDLEYASLSPLHPEDDNVTVTVYDGMEGDCLTEAEHWAYQKALGNKYPSLHPNGCVSVQVVVPIPGSIDESAGGYVLGKGYESSDRVLPDLLFWVLFSGALIWVCKKRLQRCAIRGSAIDADDDDEWDEISLT